MLLATVVLWALNLTVTRYILTHGFEPLAYATVRYGARHRDLHRDRPRRASGRCGSRAPTCRSSRVAALFIFLNQLAFVYALDTTSASTIALLLGATPAFAALIGLALGLERLSRRFWIAAAISFAGVGLVALGSGGDVSGDRRRRSCSGSRPPRPGPPTPSRSGR